MHACKNKGPRRLCCLLQEAFHGPFSHTIMSSLAKVLFFFCPSLRSPEGLYSFYFLTSSLFSSFSLISLYSHHNTLCIVSSERTHPPFQNTQSGSFKNMLQEDLQPHELVQAIRSVEKHLAPSSILPPHPDEIFYVECHPDPETQKPVVLWDDIL